MSQFKTKDECAKCGKEVDLWTEEYARFKGVCICEACMDKFIEENRN